MHTREEWEQDAQRDKAEVEHDLTEFPEESLDKAIYSGLTEGKRRYKRSRNRRIGVICTAVVASLFILFTGSIRVSPAFAAIVSDLPLLNKFVEVVRYNSVYASALESDLLQELNVKTKIGESTLTIGGIIADEDRMTVLFSIEGPDAEEISKRFSWYGIKDSSGNVIGSENFYNIVIHSNDDKSELYTKSDLVLNEGMTMPDSVILLGSYVDQSQGIEKEQPVEISIPVDQSRFAEMKEILPIHKTVEIDGQHLTIEELIITPLQAKVKVTGEANNTKQINDFLNLRLTDETGYKRKVQGIQGNLDTKGRYYIFESPYYEDPKHLTLEAEGLYLNDKDQKIQFNTDTKKILSTPDERITLEDVEVSNEKVTVSLLYSDVTTKEMGSYLNQLNQDNVLTDAAHSSYPMEMSGYHLVSDQITSKTLRYTFSFPLAEYKQPLQFQLYQYPNYAEEKISVPMK